MKKVIRVGVVLALGLAGVSVRGADIVLQTPPGWSPNPYHFHASADSDAVVLALRAVAQPDSENRVVRYSSGQVMMTDIAGKVFLLALSPSGQHTLASYLDSASGARRVTLIDSGGTRLWTKTDEREFRFSSDGSIVFTHSPGDSAIELFEPSGALTRRITTDARIAGALLFGSGEILVLWIGQSITGYDTNGSMTVDWTYQNTSAGEPVVVQLIPLGSDRFIAYQSYGWFKVLNRHTGIVAFDYNPNALATANPSKSPEWYMGLQPYRGPDDNTLILFDRRADALSLDIASGTLTDRIVDVSAPAGLSLTQAIVNNKMLLFGADQVRIRSLN